MYPENRSRRRADLARMKAKAMRIYRQPASYKLANHIAHCSGMCCGNPRRWFGELTMQERRAFEAHECDRRIA